MIHSPIYIAFATNEEYAPYTSVSIQSIIEHNDFFRVYHIYILHTMLTEETQSMFRNMSSENIKIECIDISSYLKDIPPLPEYKHITKETHYRVLIPEIFSNLSKVLYLDSDLICQTDISALYDTDLNGYWVAGAVDAHPSEGFKKEFNFSRSSYLNMGVLLMNCNAFRQNDLWKKYLELVQKYAQKLDYLNNMILNVICKDDMLLVSPKWNVLYHLSTGCCMYSEQGKIYRDYLRRFCGTIELAFILHYTATDKPWNNPQKQYMNIWWKYAKLTPCYHKIIKNSFLSATINNRN